MSPMIYFVAAVAAAAMLAGAVGAGYLKGTHDEADRHAEYRAEVEGAMAAVAERARTVAELDERNTREVEARYKVATRSLVAGYNSRLDGLRGELGECQAGLPVAESTASRPDGAAENNLLVEAGAAPAAFAEICRETERDAAACALTLVWLQEYVHKQQEAKP